ncbi:MAG: hypothetical protein OQJ89_09980 [Kangiellaceae bacterium]|nr:hypothetical protein [Kangiellaceae bacterium]MCW9017284.1 hypothetical protein [Kangiellaceae bacterium]
MDKDSIVDLDKQKQLQQALNSLPQDMEPSRELWPEIEANIKGKFTKIYTPRWIPWAIAATLVLSIGSVSWSWRTYQQAELLVRNHAAHQIDSIEQAKSALKLMEQEYRLARTALLSQIDFEIGEGQAEMITNVRSQLRVIDKATVNLKKAIELQPNDPKLPKLLKATYQQELAVLSQLVRLNQDIFSEERI